jgi:preprotein translocase subunit SecG
MLHTILNVVFVLIAIAIVALILLQRGAGAQAGSGFGAGASATVFGARGSANFLSSATKWLSVAFFGLCLFMAWQAAQQQKAAPSKDLGVMGDLPVAPATPAPAPAGQVLPAAPATPAVAPTEPVIAPAQPAATGTAPAAAPAQPQVEPATGDKAG